MNKPSLHPDGTVTYWSVFEQRWIRTDVIPDREFAAMLMDECERVFDHVHGVAFLVCHASHADEIITHGFTAGRVIARADDMPALAALVVHSREGREACGETGDGCVLVDTGERYRRLRNDEHETWADYLRDANWPSHGAENRSSQPAK